MLHEESGANPEHYQGAVMRSNPIGHSVFWNRGRRASEEAESEYKLQPNLLG